MTRKISPLAGFGMALASAQAFAHGHHSHGPALTEAERQASEGIFADKDVRTGAERLGGIWQSVNPVSAERRFRSGAGAEGQKAAARAWRNIGNIIRRATPPMWTRLASKIT
jgi:Zn/Cd-binding protein ZinT